MIYVLRCAAYKFVIKLHIYYTTLAFWNCVQVHLLLPQLKCGNSSTATIEMRTVW